MYISRSYDDEADLNLEGKTRLSGRYTGHKFRIKDVAGREMGQGEDKNKLRNNGRQNYTLNMTYIS